MNLATSHYFCFFYFSCFSWDPISKGKDMTLEQWTVGGRSFGALFVFLLMAGEIYTTFTFLGASGWAYSKGAPALYVLCIFLYRMWRPIGYCLKYGNMRKIITLCLNQISLLVNIRVPI